MPPVWARRIAQRPRRRHCPRAGATPVVRPRVSHAIQSVCKLPCRCSRSASTRCRACSTRRPPMRRQRKSSRRCCSVSAWRPTCSRSPARCRSPAIRPRTAPPGSPASSRRNSRTTRPASSSSRSASPRRWPILKTLDAKAIDASAEREITFPLGQAKGHMNGSDYLNHFVLPNFYFHLTAAYAIARHCGVEVGKRDFLGAIPIRRS